MASSVSPVRRVVTGHDASANSVFERDDSAAVRALPAPPGVTPSHFHHVWTTAAVPVDNSDGTDWATRAAEGQALGTGMNPVVGAKLIVSDTPAGGKSPTHRTPTFDVALVFSGEMTCVLDNGVEKLLKPGDVIVQRGTIHRWENRGSETCRMYFFVTAAQPLVVDGKEMGEVVIRPS